MVGTVVEGCGPSSGSRVKESGAGESAKTRRRLGEVWLIVGCNCRPELREEDVGSALEMGEKAKGF